MINCLTITGTSNEHFNGKPNNQINANMENKHKTNLNRTFKRSMLQMQCYLRGNMLQLQGSQTHQPTPQKNDLKTHKFDSRTDHSKATA